MTASNGSARGALVVSGDEQMRILLRGLLQLHRLRVDGEADGMTDALRLISQHRPALLVLDAHLAEGTAPELVRLTRAREPSVRIVLVAPASRPPPAPAPGTGPDVILLRPFRIQQFAEALTPPGPKSSG